MDDIPAEPGSYLLMLQLVDATKIEVGRLGQIHFLQGWYIYAGSAFGAGGLRGRLRRHLAGSKKQYWHIDYLRQAAIPIAYYYQVIAPSGVVEKMCWVRPITGAALDKITLWLSRSILDPGQEWSAERSQIRSRPMECDWSESLAAMPGIHVPAPGFGASDCQRRCPAHLFLLPD